MNKWAASYNMMINWLAHRLHTHTPNSIILTQQHTLSHTRILSLGAKNWTMKAWMFNSICDMMNFYFAEIIICFMIFEWRQHKVAIELVSVSQLIAWLASIFRWVRKNLANEKKNGKSWLREWATHAREWRTYWPKLRNHSDKVTGFNSRERDEYVKCKETEQKNRQ